jgi:hypothetical protein
VSSPLSAFSCAEVAVLRFARSGDACERGGIGNFDGEFGHGILL